MHKLSHNRRWLVLVALLFAMIGSPALARLAQAQEPLPTDVVVNDPTITANTLIQPGCLLEVTVVEEPKLSGRMSVADNGTIRFVLTDEDGGNMQECVVNVQGKTTTEAVKAIEMGLKTYLKAPMVSVLIARLPRLKVEIRGAAERTGTLELPVKAHLSDAMAACTYRPNADLAGIFITRKPRSIEKDGKSVPGKPRTFLVNFQAYQRGETEDDPALENGDVILLPSLPEKKPGVEVGMVRVLGEVTYERVVTFSKGMTVKDALDRVGGLKETADQEKLRLIRADGKDYVLDAIKVQDGDPVHNLPVKAGDTIIAEKRDRSLQFSVRGEVMEPRTFAWTGKEKVTILRALEMVGGPSRNADTTKVLLRKYALIRPTEVHDILVNVDLIKKGKQTDFEIEAGDELILGPKARKPTFLQQMLPFLFQFLPFGL